MDNRGFANKLVHQWDNLPPLEGVRVFVAVADTRNFRGAAKALKVPKSTVSRRLAELEQQLGFQLLQRTTRQVALTEAGESFYRQVAPALALICDAHRELIDAQQTPSGLLKITATPGLGERGLSETLIGFLREYPQVRLQLDLLDRHVDLVGEGYDAAFRVGALPDSTLVARPLSYGSAVYCASPGYLKRRGRPLRPEDIAKHDCIVFSGVQRTGRWVFRRGKRTVEVPVRGRLVVNSFQVACDAACADLGICWLPRAAARAALEKRALVTVLDEFALPPIPMQLVYPSARLMSPKVRAFVNWVQTNLKLPSSIDGAPA